MTRLGVFLLTLSAALCTAAGSSPPHYGSWKVVKYVFGNNISVGADEARKLLGKTVSYGAARASFGTETCASPTYAARRLSAGQFLQDYRTSLNSVGIKASYVETLTVRCKGGAEWASPGGFLMRLPGGDLMTVWDGVFFVLRRQGR